MNNEIKLILSLDDKGATAGLKGLEGAIKSTDNAASQSASSFQSLGAKLKALISDADSFKLKLNGLEQMLASAASTAMLWQGISIFKKSIDETEKYQNALMGLAVTAQYAGAGIDKAVSAATELTRGGLLTMADAAKGVKNLLAYGFSLEETTQLMRAFTDAAVFNRQSHYSLSEAVAVTTEGIKNETSALSDASGLGKNIGQIFEEYAKQLGKTQNELSQAEKRQAILNGFLKEAEAYAGNANLALQTLTGTKSKLSSEISVLKAQLGEVLIPVFYEFAKVLNWLLKDVIKPFVGGLEILGARMGMWAEKLSVYWEAILSGKGIAGALRDSKAKLKELEDLFEKQAMEIARKWEGKFELPITPKDTGKRRQDIEAINKEAQKLAEEWEKVRQKLQADIDKKGLDEFEKKIIDVWNEFAELRKKFGDKPKISEWLWSRLDEINLERANEVFRKQYEYQKQAEEAEIQLQKNISAVYQTETEKKLQALEDWTQKQLELAFKAFQDWETYEKQKTDIAYAEAEQRKKIAKEELISNAEKALKAYKEAGDAVRQLGETDREYSRRMIAAKAEHIGKLKEFINLLKDAGLEGEDAYKTLTREVEEFTQAQARLNAAWQDGIEHGIKEYLDVLTDMYEKGKEMAKSTAIAVENALVDMFENPKKALDNLFKYFLNVLKRMIAQALANPIIIPIQTLMTGMMGGLLGTQNQQGVMQGGLLSSVLPFLGYAGLGAGIGGMLFGGSTGSLIGGGIGGLAGGWLGSTFATQIGTKIISALGGQVSGAVGSIIFSAIPILGTLLGGILGSWIGKLFGGKKKLPEMFLDFRAGMDPSQWTPGKHWTGGAIGTEGGTWGFGYKNVGDWSKEQQQILKMFADTRLTVMKELEALGLDISGFFKDWHKWFPDLRGKTAEEIEQLLKKAMGEYLEFASGIDFSQWQKSGEDLIDTIGRILGAFKAFPKVLDNIDDYIDAINQKDDDVAKWKKSLIDAKQQLDEMWESLKKLEDPTDVLQTIDKLKQATYEYYMSQIQFVQQLDAAIKALEVEMMNFQTSMLAKIADLTGNFSASIDALAAAMANALSNMANAQTAGEQLQWLQQYISYLDQWVAANIAAIQAMYQAQIDAINAQIDAINDQIEALQEQKELIQKQLEGLRDQLKITQDWKRILESVKKQILDMMTTLDSPRDVFERMHYLRSEMERIKRLYLSETDPSKKAEYAQQLQDLIRDYLNLAQEAFQRPSPEYQAIYNEMLKWLEEIQKTAESYASKEEQLLAEIKRLEEESKAIDEQIKTLQEQIKDYQKQIADLNKQMQEDIAAFKAEAAHYYEWAMNEGMRLYQEKLNELKEKLGDILGELTLQEYIALKQKEATEALQALKVWAEEYWTNFKNALQGNDTTGGGSQEQPKQPPAECPACGFVYGQHAAWCPYAYQWSAASGAFVTKPTKMVVGEGGEPEWIIPLSKMKDFANITVAPSITINANGNVNAKEIAEEVENIIVNSIKYGKARALIRRT